MLGETLREFVFVIGLAISVVLHVGAVGVGYWFGGDVIVEPRAYPAREGRASVRVAASPESPKLVPRVAEKPELAPVPEPEPEVAPPPQTPPPPFVVKDLLLAKYIPEPKPVITPPKELEVAPLPKKEPPPKKKPEPVKKKDTPKKVEAPVLVKKAEEGKQADVPSLPSKGAIGSEASEGVLDNPIEVPINRPIPYPAEALLYGHEGRVELAIKLDATGKVLNVRLYKSSGYSSLDNQALESMRHWRFYPARRNGVAIPYEFWKPVDFNIRRR